MRAYRPSMPPRSTFCGLATTTNTLPTLSISLPPPPFHPLSSTPNKSLSSRVRTDDIFHRFGASFGMMATRTSTTPARRWRRHSTPSTVSLRHRDRIAILSSSPGAQLALSRNVASNGVQCRSKRKANGPATAGSTHSVHVPRCTRGAMAAQRECLELAERENSRNQANDGKTRVEMMEWRAGGWSESNFLITVGFRVWT